jgi:hypothetical protein
MEGKQQKKESLCKSEAFLFLSDPDWTRTNDPQLRRLLLYPAELRDQENGCEDTKTKQMQNGIPQ